MAPSDAYEFGGASIAGCAEHVSALKNPPWGTLHLRVQYDRPFGPAIAELSVDVFNVPNDQGAIRNQDVVAGQGTQAFGDPIP